MRHQKQKVIALTVAFRSTILWILCDIFLATTLTAQVSNHDRGAAYPEEQNHAELSTFYASEIYNQTGEVKSGFGIRGRYWFDRWGVEAQGLSLTPRDSIVDRSDLSACWRYQFGERDEACRWFQAPLLARSGQDNADVFRARSGSMPPPLRSPFSLILSAGYGANWEDSEHGPGIGASLQWSRGSWFAETGARVIQEEQSKTLVTVGIGRKF